MNSVDKLRDKSLKFAPNIRRDVLKELMNNYVDEMIVIERNAKTVCERQDKEAKCTDLFAERIRELMKEGGDD